MPPGGRRKVTFRLRVSHHRNSSRTNDDDDYDDDDNNNNNMKVVVPETRRSESAVVTLKPDPDFVLPRKTALHGARNSLVDMRPPIQRSSITTATSTFSPLGHDGFGATGGWRDFMASDLFDSTFRASDVSNGYGEYFGLDDDATSNVFSTVSGSEPYAGIVIEITNHSFDPQGAVMYHVDIKGPDGMLSAYTIRKRYTQFKELHHELGKLFEEYHHIQQHQSAARSLERNSSQSNVDQCSSETVASPACFEVTNNVTPGASGTTNSFVSTSYCQMPISSSSTAGGVNGTLSRETLRSTLPPLPGAGVWSYLRRHDSHLVERRKKRFEDILRLAIVHPASKYSHVLGDFLSNAPSLISQRGSSYVSLKDYSVPVMDHHRESMERKLLKKKKLASRIMRSQSDGATQLSADVPT